MPPRVAAQVAWVSSAGFGAAVSTRGGHTGPGAVHEAVCRRPAPLTMVAKRLADILGASLLLILTAPVMVLIGIVVRLTDGGPTLFRHERVGRRGEPFQCLKFRSMAMDAEAALKDLLAARSRGPGGMAGDAQAAAGSANHPARAHSPRKSRWMNCHNC